MPIGRLGLVQLINVCYNFYNMINFRRVEVDKMYIDIKNVIGIPIAIIVLIIIVCVIGIVFIKHK